jgi:molybdopterin molybdochelatase
MTLLGLLQDNHLIVINAGSSAGSKDFTAAIIQELGEVALHGIAIKPGKPTILGMVQGKPVIGVPGYPGSAYLVFEEVVLPILRALNHQPEISRTKTKAVLSRRLISSLKHREYVRVTLGKVGDRLIATPLNRGAGVTMTLVKATECWSFPRMLRGTTPGKKWKSSCSRI